MRKCRWIQFEKKKNNASLILPHFDRFLLVSAAIKSLQYFLFYAWFVSNYEYYYYHILSCDDSKFVFPPNWEQAIEIIIMGWNLFCIFTNYLFFFRRYIHKNMYSQTFPSGSVGRMSVSSFLVEVWVQIRNIRIISFFIRSILKYAVSTISIDVGSSTSFVSFYLSNQADFLPIKVWIL